MRMQAAIYTRFSSTLQNPRSLEDQETLCRHAAARFGCTVDGKVFSDREISGAVADRPGYRALLQAAERGEYAAIITEAQDRLWRDQAEMHRALKVLRHHGVKVFSVATGTDLTSETGRILA